MKTVSDLFEPYIGTKEYNGIVATIQRWFYRCEDIVRASWCATSMSYFLNELGLLSKIGKRQENVYQMMKMCESAAKNGVGTFYYRNDIPQNFNILRGTIIFMLNSDPPMTETSSKHVTSMYENTKWKGSGNWKGLGGNQSDMIRVSQYTQAKIYAIYIPPYSEESKHETLRRGDKGDSVKELQTSLNNLGYVDDSGNKLVVDGSFGAKTEETVISFQGTTGLVEDGVCGKLTWAEIDKGIHVVDHKVKTTTTLYSRKHASTSASIIGVLTTGYNDTWSQEKNGFAFLKKAKGWSSKKFLASVK